MTRTHIDLDLLTREAMGASGHIVLGIDGIVDEVYEVVDHASIDSRGVELVTQFARFGELIVERGTGGLSKEILQKRQVSGGFSANTGRTLGALAVETTLVGTFGSAPQDPAFGDLTSTCSLFSVGDPSRCHILEFLDGKLMLVDLNGNRAFDWERLAAACDKAGLFPVLGRADVLGLGYWSNFDNFDQIVTNLIRSLPDDRLQRLFFDFGNVTKKTTEALRDTAARMAAWNKSVPVTLSLNDHEGRFLLRCLDIDFGMEHGSVVPAWDELARVIAIDELILHTEDYAVIASAGAETVLVPQHHVQCPVRTAGAGDTFNGGYIFSLLTAMRAQERLLVANAAAHFYVTNGRPPSREELVREAAVVSGGSDV